MVSIDIRSARRASIMLSLENIVVNCVALKCDKVYYFVPGHWFGKAKM